MAGPPVKRSISLPLVISGLVSSLALAIGMSPTLSSFTASIANGANSAGSGTIVMQETDSSGTVTCLSTDQGGVSLNTAACPGINRYGGSMGMHPGDSVAVVTYLKNVGTVAASSFGLTPGPCVQSVSGGVSGTATDFCSKVLVTISSGPTTIFSGTAAAFGSAGTVDVLAKLGLAKVAAGAQTTITVTALMDPSADNTYQGLEISQPMTWSFGA